MNYAPTQNEFFNSVMQSEEFVHYTNSTNKQMYTSYQEDKYFDIQNELRNIAILSDN